MIFKYGFFGEANRAGNETKPIFYERFLNPNNIRRIDGWQRFGLFRFSIGLLLSSFLLGSLP